MKTTISTDSKLLFSNRGFFSRLISCFKSQGPMDELIHKNYQPYGKNKNPLVHTFKRVGRDTQEPLKLNPELEYFLVCREHKFCGLVTPKYYGEDCVSFVICPHCNEIDGFMVTLTPEKLDKILKEGDKPFMEKSKRSLYVTGAWRRLRKRYPNYTHRWTYINGVAVRVDNNGRGTQFDA